MSQSFESNLGCLLLFLVSLGVGYTVRKPNWWFQVDLAQRGQPKIRRKWGELCHMNGYDITFKNEMTVWHGLIFKENLNSAWCLVFCWGLLWHHLPHWLKIKISIMICVCRSQIAETCVSSAEKKKELDEGAVSRQWHDHVTIPNDPLIVNLWNFQLQALICGCTLNTI